MPNLFVLGAPKCGTSSLYFYLRQHPDIFMPRRELHYFGEDLVLRNKGRLSLEEYLAFFDDAGSERYRGEVAIWYLFSATAAAEIVAASPDARCIVMVRNPVDMIHSLHSEFLYQGDEDIADFGAALDAEADRARGERIPARCNTPWALQYRAVARFSTQVERCYEMLGKERVHVVLTDDLATDTASARRDVLRFLELDEHIELKSPEVVNSNKEVRSPALRQFLRRPPAPLRKLGHMVVRNPMSRRALGQKLTTFNTTQTTRAPMDADLRRRLQAEFADDVERLGTLIGRDLSAWSQPVAAKQPAD
jgi:hypothetical protein